MDDANYDVARWRDPPLDKPSRTHNAFEGYHSFAPQDGGPNYGSFKVFWYEGHHEGEQDGEPYDEPYDYPPGWYWYACFPGCIPDGDPSGPYLSSALAFQHANEGA